MKHLKEYQIPFLGLKVGVHEYEFTLDNAFFEAFEYSEIAEATVNVHLSLEKQSTMLVLDFTMQGEVQLLCDRCGDPFMQDIVSKDRLIVKFGDETGHTHDDILVLGPGENAVDVSQYLYEYAHLALPAKHVHTSEKECNQEVLAAYKKYTVDSDSRDNWAELKNLHFEENEPLDIDEEE